MLLHLGLAINGCEAAVTGVGGRGGMDGLAVMLSDHYPLLILRYTVPPRTAT